MTLLLSHSQLATFRRCPREWYYRYVARREPRVVTGARSKGRSIHKAIGAWYRGEDAKTVAAQVDDVAMRALFLGYVVRWGAEPLKVEKTDVPFKTKLAKLDVALTGELDAIGLETIPPAAPEKIIMEHKTTSEDIAPGSAYWQRVTLIDPQVSTYMHVGSQLGYTKIVYDVMRKPLLRQKQKETPEEFGVRILEDISTRFDWYYQRCDVVRLEEERAAFEKDIEGTVHLIQAARANRNAPRNPDSCFKWNRPCDFFLVCTNEVDINDDARFMDREHHADTIAAAAETSGLRGPEDR